MKADLRISVKDYRRNKNLKIQLTQVPFAASRQFCLRMNGELDPGFHDPPVTADLQAIQDYINSLVSTLCS
jgi:hypothetical protein